jgi:hypothetical protein
MRAGQTSAVNFLDALLKSPHAGKHSAMFRHHFEERGLKETLQVRSSPSILFPITIITAHCLRDILCLRLVH